VQQRIIGHFQCVYILIVYLHNAMIIQEFLNILNNLTPTMHFTIQEGYENTVNFLDIAISYIDNNIMFIIHRNLPQMTASSQTTLATPQNADCQQLIPNLPSINIPHKWKGKRNENDKIKERLYNNKYVTEVVKNISRKNYEQENKGRKKNEEGQNLHVFEQTQS